MDQRFAAFDKRTIQLVHDAMHTVDPILVFERPLKYQ